MEERKDYFVYKYTFPNRKVYIGQSNDTSTRFGHPSNYKTSPLVYKAMMKYKTFEKEKLEKNLSSEEANSKEIFYISFYDSTNRRKGYNISTGGFSLKKGNIPWNKGMKTGIIPPNKNKKRSEWINEEYLEKLHLQAIENCKLARERGTANTYQKGNIPHNITKCYLLDTLENKKIYFESIKKAFLSLGYKTNKNSGRYLNKDKLLKNRYLLKREVIL